MGVGLSYVPSVAAVQRWFHRGRGTASGIAIAGIGVGTLIGAPLAHELIARLGWRPTYLVLAALTALGAVVVGRARAPRTRALRPRARRRPAQPARARGRPPGCSLREAMRTWPFWTIYTGALLMSFGLFVPFVHLVPYARDAGLGEGFGVLLIMLLGVGSTVGRFLFASLTNWLGRRRSFAMMYVGAGADAARCGRSRPARRRWSSSRCCSAPSTAASSPSRPRSRPTISAPGRSAR